MTGSRSRSEDRPEWISSTSPPSPVRGITVGLYPTNPTAEVEYLLTDCGANVHLAEDQEQVDKVVMTPAQRVPALTTIVYLEPRGLQDYDDARLMAWEDLLALGRKHRAEHGDAVEARMAAAEPDGRDDARLHVGDDRPAEGRHVDERQRRLRHREDRHAPASAAGRKPPDSHDVIITYLPLCHVAERIFSTWHLVSCGTVLNFAESIDTITANLREVQPTLFFAVPRIWEKIHAGVLIRSQRRQPG